MPTTPSDPVIRAVALVSGRVQMVGFRFWTRGEALARDLRGSAVNLPDGRVEVVLEGPRSSVQSMVEALSSGPPSARVDGVDTRWESPTGERGFGLG